MLQVLCGTVVCVYNTMDLFLCFRHYREAESKLRSLDVWCANKHVRNWVNAKWQSIPEVHFVFDYWSWMAQRAECYWQFLRVFSIVFYFIQRWSRAWTEREYHHNVFSNNGIEAQSKVRIFSIADLAKLYTYT